MRWIPLLLSLLAAPAAAQTSPGVLVQAEAQNQRLSCGGGDALIEGNHNTIVLTGPCRGLLLKGVANTVAIALQAGASVRVEGSENRVIFDVAGGAAPVVQILGPNNSVDPGPLPPAPPPPAAPALKPAETAAVLAVPAAKPPRVEPAAGPARSGALELRGDDQQRDETCAGRAVVIEGNRSAYVLRGGCLSVSVQGDLDTVQAELRPGASVHVTGHGTTVSWAVPTRGKAPVSAIHGDGNRVQHIDTIGGQPVP
jgi:Protein of unknown function (DUF3060)